MVSINNIRPMSGYEIKPSRWLSFDFKELWQFRELCFFMAWRDIKVKYKQTLLGLGWVILQPLVLMFIFSVIWLHVMKFVTVEVPYPLFAYSGLILWGLFSSGISSASESMIANSNIIKKVYFPRIIIPASAIMVALFDFLMTLAVYILMILYYHLHIHVLRFFCLLPLSVLITIVSSFGLGLIFSSATIKYRDFRYVVPFFLQAFFFLSPIIVPLSLFGSERLGFILSLNPLAGAINLGRSAITNNAVEWDVVLYTITVTVLLLITGLTSFRKAESQYADLL
jgi:lipopolysaccharide transport system permease protein